MCHCYIEHLTKVVRWGASPNHPCLLEEWLEITAPDKDLVLSDVRNQLLMQYQTLLDALSDEWVPLHWRQLCMNNIYRPLLALEQLADCQISQGHVRSLYYELRVISEYAFPYAGVKK